MFSGRMASSLRSNASNQTKWSGATVSVSRKSGVQVPVESFVPAISDSIPAGTCCQGTMRRLILTPTLDRHVGRHGSSVSIPPVDRCKSLTRATLVALIVWFSYSGSASASGFGIGGSTQVHHHSSFPEKPPYTYWRRSKSYILSPTHSH